FSSPDHSQGKTKNQRGIMMPPLIKVTRYHSSFFGTVSFLTILINATTISSKITVNGSADVSDAVCNAFKPPANNRTTAIAVIRTPQMIFTINAGFKLPLDVILPNI